jgi:hypothetical protein
MTVFMSTLDAEPGFNEMFENTGWTEGELMFSDVIRKFGGFGNRSKLVVAFSRVVTTASGQQTQCMAKHYVDLHHPGAVENLHEACMLAVDAAVIELGPAPFWTFSWLGDSSIGISHEPAVGGKTMIVNIGRPSMTSNMLAEYLAASLQSTETARRGRTVPKVGQESSCRLS